MNEVTEMIIKLENKTGKDVSAEMTIIYESHGVKSMSSTYFEPNNPNAEKIRRIDINIE